MAGLLTPSKEMPVRGEEAMPPTPSPREAMPAPSPKEGDSENGGETEQGKKFAGNLLLTAYDGKVLPTIIDQLRTAENKGEALAHAVVMVISRVEDSSPEPIDPNLVFEAGAGLLADLAALAEKLNIHEYTQEEIDGAFLQGVDLYRSMRAKQGKIDPAKAKEEIELLKQAEQEGRLDDIVPGISDFAERAKARKPPEEEMDADEEAAPPPGLMARRA